MRSAIEINGLDELKRDLTELQLTKYPSAMRNAINYTLDDVKAAEVARMQVDFKNPTQFTLNSLKKEEAKKTNLVGRVWFKDPTRLSESQHYLYPNTYGVKRGHKPFEAALYRRGIMAAGDYAVPGNGAPRDSYGNIPASLYVQILSFFNAFSEVGSKQNMTDSTREKRRRGTKKTYGYEYFAIKKRAGGLVPGIYKRTFHPLGARIETMFIFTKNQWYTRLYKFHETGKHTFESNFKAKFGNELDRMLNELK